MNNILSRKIWSIVVAIAIAAILLFTAVISANAAWTPPISSDLADNTDAPIHVGSVGQKKDGVTWVPSWLWNAAMGQEDAIGVDKFMSTESIFSQKIHALEFCLRDPASSNPVYLDGIQALTGQQPNQFDCITEWPTPTPVTPPATSLWQDLGDMLAPFTGRDVLVSGTSFGGAGTSANLFLGDQNHKVTANWGQGLSLSTFGADAQDAVFIQQGTGNTWIGNPLTTALGSSMTDLNSFFGTGFKLNSPGNAHLMGDNLLSTVPLDSQTTIGLNIVSQGIPAYDNAKLRVNGDQYNTGVLTVEDDAYLQGRTNAHRITVADQGNSSIPGGVLEAWNGEFQWNGAGGEFHVGSPAQFGSDVVVDQLAHANPNPVPVCADATGKLVLCDQESGSQYFTWNTSGDGPNRTYTSLRTYGSLGTSIPTSSFNLSLLPNTVQNITVEVWGGGGSGATGVDGVNEGGAGGGAGGYAKRTYAIGSLPSNIPLTVGRGGYSNSGQGGNDGEDSRFNNSLLGRGGKAGRGPESGTGSYLGGAGGAASGGEVNTPGDSGQNSNPAADSSLVQNNCSGSARKGGSGGVPAGNPPGAGAGVGGAGCAANGSPGWNGGTASGGGGGEGADGRQVGPDWDAGRGGSGGAGMIKISW